MAFAFVCGLTLATGLPLRGPIGYNHRKCPATVAGRDAIQETPGTSFVSTAKMALAGVVQERLVLGNTLAWPNMPAIRSK